MGNMGIRIPPVVGIVIKYWFKPCASTLTNIQKLAQNINPT
jgi:hypothetical protein